MNPLIFADTTPFDESEWAVLAKQNAGRINVSMLANFGFKADVVQAYALKRAARAIHEIEQKPLDEIIEVMCEYPMPRSAARIAATYLTVSETYFFRHPENFAWVRDSFLPELEIREKGLACWSVGCSTGEEAYSLAITLREYFTIENGWDIGVFASDINPASLEIAKKGCFGDWSFRGVAKEIKNKYFSLCEKDPSHFPGLPQPARFRINDDIRSMVQFFELNLTSADWVFPMPRGREFDLIFCRNVLIYFPKDIAIQVVARLSSYLAPHGKLIVGPSEAWLVDSSENSIHSKANISAFSHKVTEPRKKTVTILKPIPSPREPLEKLQNSANSKSSEIRSILLVSVKAFLDRGNYAEAIDLLTTRIQDDPIDAQMFYLRALALLGTKKRAEAQADLEKSLFLEPDNTLAYIALAAVAKEAGDFENMKKQYSNALYVLSKMKETDIVPGSEGIPAGAMRDMIVSLAGNRNDEQ